MARGRSPTRNITAASIERSPTRSPRRKLTRPDASVRTSLYRKISALCTTSCCRQSGRLFTQTGFSIDMTVEISPKSGPVGTPIHVEVKGIGFRSLYNSWDVLYDNAFTGWISSVTTHGSASFTIPATGGPGVHILEVLHGELTFPYRNMQQSPEPDRPRWAIPFTVTADAPVLPPPPEQQARQNSPVQARQDELVAMPQSSGVGEPVVVVSGGLGPGNIYRLNWTRLVGNRMTGTGWQELST